MEIGPANTGAMDFDEDVVDPDGGLRNIFEPKARLGFIFDERFHSFF
jgi:hypothetical protein